MVPCRHKKHERHITDMTTLGASNSLGQEMKNAFRLRRENHITQRLDRVGVASQRDQNRSRAPKRFAVVRLCANVERFEGITGLKPVILGATDEQLHILSIAVRKRRPGQRVSPIG